MTERRKQELRRLLEEARGRLEVHPLPEDVYRRYLQERWKYFGLDRFSPFWIQPTLDIGSETTKSRLLEFIRDALAQFLGDDGDTISVANYFIERHSTNQPRLNRVDDTPRTIDVAFILKRLVEISLVRGLDHAVSVFDECSRPGGSHVSFQCVSHVKGLTLKADTEVCRGIRLVPLLDSGISAEVIACYPDFPYFSFSYEFPNFFDQTLLVIDRPGFTIFHKPGTDQELPQDLSVGDLPSKVGKYDSTLQNRCEVVSYRKSFSQALSLTLGFPIEIPHEGFYPAEDRTFSPRHISMISFIPANRFKYCVRADETHVEQARRLYKRLVDFNAKDRRKLLIAIDRWIKSKATGNDADKIIDLGIALEALYVSESCKKGKGWQIRKNASAHLGDNPTHRAKLKTKFKAIYEMRSDVVHNREFGKEAEVDNRFVPITDFVTTAQNLCHESIRKIIKKRKFPDWNSLRQTAKQHDQASD